MEPADQVPNADPKVANPPLIKETEILIHQANAESEGSFSQKEDTIPGQASSANHKVTKYRIMEPADQVLNADPKVANLPLIKETEILIHQANASDFLDTLLRFTGITASPSQTRVNDGVREGDIWLVHVGEEEASEPRKITSDGAYHTPLWVPQSQSILAMKGDKLVQLSVQGNEEKTLHTLTDNTELLGFDKNNPSLMLVLQESLAGVLTLANGQITPIPYDKKMPEDRYRLDQLRSGFRDYGTAQVSIENQSKVDPRGLFKELNTIHIKRSTKDIFISCPSTCSQPAFAEDGGQLLFIGHR
jgi:hypothetical protein